MEDQDKDTWSVTIGDERISYSATTLISQFINKLNNVPEPYDQNLLIESIFNTMPNDTLQNATLKNILALGFRFGYYYRVFVEKNNDVSLPEQMPATTTSEST